ncbi:hypothetical protein Pmani_025990 [Petrolisthes manimaculis]|uniref:Uncharacterized protein n=1 Tax=Petrolisthes manimaculis TaxID=1843537 RepID=A0AAE1TXU5_9EUCA|nr:hypothetical protein Pmani_025990 [Petrolisthes manimaculis]
MNFMFAAVQKPREEGEEEEEEEEEKKKIEEEEIDRDLWLRIIVVSENHLASMFTSPRQGRRSARGPRVGQPASQPNSGVVAGSAGIPTHTPHLDTPLLSTPQLSYSHHTMSG